MRYISSFSLSRTNSYRARDKVNAKLTKVVHVRLRKLLLIATTNYCPRHKKLFIFFYIKRNFKKNDQYLRTMIESY